MFRTSRRCSIQSLLNLHVPKRSCRSVASGEQISFEDEPTTEIKKLIEAKWGHKVYGLSPPENTAKNGKQKYILSMFPYPSGRLHLGHVRVYTISDVLARYNRLCGYEVVHPLGWDAFGLPAENAARDRGIDPAEWTKDNIAAMKKQIIDMGCCFDWDRELSTCDPRYYKWTQWLFLKLYHEGLAYKKKSYVFWDPVDNTVLAEEQVDAEGRSWRSGALVEKKLLNQWFIRTAVFAKQLTVGLDSNLLRDGWKDVTDLQKNWIGSIAGFFSDCHVLSEDPLLDETLRIWFSSPEPLRHAQFVIIQPNHYLAKDENNMIHTYSNGLKQLNFMVLNPATGINLPVFTGPPELDMPIIPESADCRIDEILSDSVFPTISANDSFMSAIRKACENRKLIGAFKKEHVHPFVFHPASLRLRDWLVSRQRRWGTPIPAVNCSDCGIPSVLPDSYLPFDNKSADLSAVKCQHCGSSNVKGETDTLDTFFDSSWYFLRFLDVDNTSSIFDPSKVKPHMPVDVYIGGKEHANLHLYYARFMTQFLEKLGLTQVHEPFKSLIPVGVVAGECYQVSKTGKFITADQVEPKGKRLVDKESGLFVEKKWEKMSKSKHNGIEPESLIEEYGLDTTRLLTMADVAPTSYRRWNSSQFPAYLKFQRRQWLAVRELQAANEKEAIENIVDTDEWEKHEKYLFDKRNYYLKELIHIYETTFQISVAVSRLQALISQCFKVPKSHIKGSIQFERVLGLSIIGAYPIMPAYTAYLWESFRDVATLTENEFDLNKQVWEQKIPTIDPNYELNLVCEVDSNEICTIKVPRAILDNLDLNVALEMALEHPDIEKRVHRETCSVVSYKVWPKYEAKLNIVCKEEVARRKYKFNSNNNNNSVGSVDDG